MSYIFITKENFAGHDATSVKSLAHNGIHNNSSNDEVFRNEQFEAARQRQANGGMGISADSVSSFAHNGINNASSNDPNHAAQQFEIAKRRYAQNS